ncbi:hypothetical protein [Parabacteroides sp. ZJ-118]|uniref:hypothetical protein n=1 Tax=Parabacteroides sp. ZJ-118 TaxID=2709398 RepID=UPI0013EA183A|nr:hypothetical protein [Parabacteroides sp. ZJ-118]
MRTSYKKEEERSGVRLIALLENHLQDILSREADNHTFIYLYRTGPYWVAFEKSAYFLHRISSRAQVIPMRPTTYPFPIVMVAWADKELWAYSRTHLFLREGDDYGRLSAPSHSLEGYREWHTEEVGDFSVPQTRFLLEN